MLKIKEISDSILNKNINRLPYFQAKFFFTLQLINALFRDISSGQISLRAMSLVYTTVISLVPFLAVSFSVLKGFGAHNQIKPMLENALSPLGEKANEITNKLVGFVDNIEVGVLGAVGIGFLIFTVLSMIKKIEMSFNYIWNISKGRGFSRRFADYLSVLLIGPVLIFVSTGISTAKRTGDLISDLENQYYLSWLIDLSSSLVPYLLMTVAFAFIYSFVPNTKVKLKPAIIAGLITAIIWKLMGWGFTQFVINSASHASIYAAFATLIIFMIWLYLAWFVLLLGSSIAYYIQYPNSISERRFNSKISQENKEKIALNIVLLIAKSFELEEKEVSIKSISRKFQIPFSLVEKIFDQLVNGGIINEISSNNKNLRHEENFFSLARPANKINFFEIIEAVKTENSRKIKADQEIENEYKDYNEYIAKKYKKLTLEKILDKSVD